MWDRGQVWIGLCGVVSGDVSFSSPPHRPCWVGSLLKRVKSRTFRGSLFTSALSSPCSLVVLLLILLFFFFSPHLPQLRKLLRPASIHKKEQKSTTLQWGNNLCVVKVSNAECYRGPGLFQSIWLQFLSSIHPSIHWSIHPLQIFTAVNFCILQISLSCLGLCLWPFPFRAHVEFWMRI